MLFNNYALRLNDVLSAQYFTVFSGGFRAGRVAVGRRTAGDHPGTPGRSKFTNRPVRHDVRKLTIIAHYYRTTV